MATQAEVAAHLFLDPSAVSRMVSAGELPAPAGRGGLDKDACREAYIRRLREQAAGRMGAGGDLDLTAERARLAKEQADGQELKNAISRSELLLKSHVILAGQNFVARCRAKLLAIPSRAAPLLLPMKTAVAIEDMLRRLVNEALAELAGIRVIANDAAQPGGGGDGDGMGGGVEPAADVDGEPVGGREALPKRGRQRRAG